MIPLKYATASQEIPLGPALDSTNGNDEEGGLTIANTDIKLWKSGATTLASKNSGGATYISNGVYYLVLDATDSDTYGPMVIFVHVAGALTMKVECVVMNAEAYDALYAASGTGHIEADAVQISGDAAAADNLELAGGNYSATRGLAGTALPAAVADAAGGVPISDAGGLDLDAKLANTHEITAARMGALTDWINAGRLDAILDTIATDAARVTAARAQVLDDWINAGRLDLLLDAIPTTAMRGTDSAALASVCTEARLAELAAANIPADIDTLLTRVTAAVALASVCTEGRLSELAAANLPADIDTIVGYLDTEIAAIVTHLTDIKGAGWTDENLKDVDALIDAIKAKTDNQPAGVPKNVALDKFPFLMINSVDHITPKTGLTVTAQTNKDGVGFAGSANSPVEVGSGWYEIDWIQAEMNFNVAAWKFTAVGADQRDITVITST